MEWNSQMSASSECDLRDQTTPVVAEARCDPRRQRVVMLGPALSVKGGVSSVEALLIDALSDRFDIKHVATLSEGGSFTKLATAITALGRFIGLAVTWRPDLVHVHFASRASFWRKSIFIVVAKVFGMKVVGHAHGAQFNIFYDIESGPIRRFLIRALFRRFDRLVAISSWWHDYYITMRACPTELIPNPVRQQVAIVRVDHGERTVLMMGRLGERKGVYDLIQAIPIVLASCPQTRFVLAGDGDIERCRALVAQFPWADRVSIPGWTSGDERLRLYRAADLFVLPSYNEGLPMAILEAMSFGLPVVSTPVGGIPELVQNGRNGTLVAPGDVGGLASAISALLSDVNRLRAYGEQSKSIVDNTFELKLVAARFGRLYESICTG